jgi:hypothetical protein
MGERGAEVFGHLLPVRFVVGELGVPLSRRLGIKRDSQMSRLLVVEDVQQRLSKSVEG